ncbi:MAG TPA: amylo-alpha-1,6-glucosidase [Acetobacteraceae bacterium]|nr:amylo-alpha-1,6-glucosidase [Acetobacteraceae bacterium]
MTVTGAPPEEEWLEADGLGGFASGTVGGPRTCRYHALLLTATTPPTGRFVLVNGIEAWVETAGGRTPLSAQRYAPDTLHPDGWRHIARFDRTPWPSWTYRLTDGSVITQEILVARDAVTTVLRWRRVQGSGTCRLLVRPLLSGRDYHSLHNENPVFDFTPTVRAGNVAWRPYRGVPAIAALSNGAYTHAPLWFRRFLYPVERERGLDDIEDLASPGEFAWDLARGEAVLLLRAGDGLGARPAPYAAALMESERARRAAAASPLALAAASYLVDRGAARTVIAGFPWFTDWGRDTFIALRGLALATGRLDDAEAILTAWSGHVSEGMLPNRFPDSGDRPEYNSVDASLWFTVAVHDFLQAATAARRVVDRDSQQRLQAAVEAILQGYSAGTRFGIALDADGLLRAGVPGVQLTWMDAKTGDHVVTPRIGKPVEVQALWINALRIGSRWSSRWAMPEERARRTFLARFPDPATGGLLDVVDADHRPGAVAAELRPNQILAVGGLPFQVVDGALARGIVDCVERSLLTPLGLRSLAPQDPAYCPHYRGSPAERDGTYHQGTVWPWLIGPFVEAWLRVHDNSETARAEGRARFLPPLRAHLETAGLGHVSEIADGDPPHTPRGCPFQAWSLSELIRIERMLTEDRTTHA